MSRYYSPQKRTRARAAAALALIQERPGISTAELASSIGLTSPSVLRVLSILKDEGKIVPGVRSWHPADVRQSDSQGAESPSLEVRLPLAVFNDRAFVIAMLRHTNRRESSDGR
jgi:Winged helix-turn-helix DNA-binding